MGFNKNQYFTDIDILLPRSARGASPLQPPRVPGVGRPPVGGGVGHLPHSPPITIISEFRGQYPRGDLTYNITVWGAVDPPAHSSRLSSGGPGVPHRGGSHGNIFPRFPPHLILHTSSAVNSPVYFLFFEPSFFFGFRCTREFSLVRAAGGRPPPLLLLQLLDPRVPGLPLLLFLRHQHAQL